MASCVWKCLAQQVRLWSGFLGQCFLIHVPLTLEGSKITSMEVMESTEGKQTNFRRAEPNFLGQQLHS